MFYQETTTSQIIAVHQITAIITIIRGHHLHIIKITKSDKLRQPKDEQEKKKEKKVNQNQ